MKELRFLQPNQIDDETRNDPVKLKAYFDWKYENFEEEYKIYCDEKRKLKDEFLNVLSPEKREYYQKRYEEYFDKFYAIDDKYYPLIEKAMENKDYTLVAKMIEEENAESQKLKEEYKDIEFMLK